MTYMLLLNCALKLVEEIILIESIFANKALVAICSLVTSPVTFSTLKQTVMCHERRSATALLVQNNLFGFPFKTIGLM